MPATRQASVRQETLPSIATVAEIAAFERVDERTIRKALEAGEVTGAFRRGRSWRIVTAAYLGGISGTCDISAPRDA